jgi:hypothetical protein
MDEFINTLEVEMLENANLKSALLNKRKFCYNQDIGFAKYKKFNLIYICHAKGLTSSNFISRGSEVF